MPPSLFDLATEIRLKIYKELLVHSGPIQFRGFDNKTQKSLFLSKSTYDGEPYHLYPQVLRVNKKAHDEASSLLYSNNRFTFWCMDPTTQDFAFTLFLGQVKSRNATQLRHIYVDFPLFGGREDEKRESLQTLDLIRDNCPSITTIEVSLRGVLPSVYDPIDAMVLQDLDTRLKEIKSLRKIYVEVYVFASLINSRVGDGPRDVPTCDESMKTLREYGWKLKVIKCEEYEGSVWSDA